MAVDWSVGLIVVIFICGASVGYATSFYQRHQRRRASGPAQMKHRLQLLFDSHLFDAYSNDAIDHFIQALAVKPETLPVHIAIGRHFRQQGEVDKAILIHQNLLTYPALSDETSGAVTFELARDYQKAGLLDRAETLLLELAKSSSHGRPSQQLLLEIYEQQRDWSKAVAIGLKACVPGDPALQLRLAHYYCELAEEAGARFSRTDIVELYRKALAASEECVRARLALAHIHLHEGKVQQAFDEACQVVENSDYAVLAVPVFERCLEDAELRSSVLAYLAALSSAGECSDKPLWPILLLLMQQPEQVESMESGLLQSLAQHASAQALHYYLQHTQSGQQALLEPSRQLVLDYLDRESREQNSYLCHHCGFAGARMYWQCPGCHDWQSILPVLG